MSMELGDGVRWAFWLVVLALSLHPALSTGAVRSVHRLCR